MCSVLFSSANSESTSVPIWQAPANILSKITTTLLTQPQFKLLQLLSILFCDSKAIEFNADLWEGMP